MAAETVIQFQHADTELVGALSVPSGRGPHPAIAFLHGYGPENRDGGGLYRQMWRRFTANGFGCLCWDKPGVGESTGDWRKQSYEDRAHETIAAIHFLQEREEIDPARVGVWGLSQGGIISVLTAVLSPDVAFIIPVSTPAVDFIEGEMFSTEATMRGEGASDEDIRRACEVILKEMELIRDGAAIDEVIAVTAAIKDEPWFRTFDYITYGEDWTADKFESVKQHMVFDLRSHLLNVTCPVLAIWGELDSNVPAKGSLETFRENLENASTSDVTLTIFPMADHCLFPTRTGGMREMLQSWKELRGFVPGYLETISEWLAARFMSSSNQA